MHRFVGIFILLAGCTAPMRALPLDVVFERPEGRLPYRFTFSPDGTRVAFLKTRAEGGLTDLWELDWDSGRERTLLKADRPEELSEAEKSARERRRERTIGISRFWWHPSGDRMLLALSGDLWELRDGALSQLTKTKAPERTPAWSPDGTTLAYVRERNVYLRDGGGERALTTQGGGDVRCGEAEFIAQEELGRHRGFWWSQDSQRIAYAVVDEAHVPRFLMHRYLPERGESVAQVYPRAGDRNVAWTLKVKERDGSATCDVAVDGEYLVRVDWAPDGALYVQTSDRAQRVLKLWRCDAGTGAAQVVFEERDEAWVRFHRDLRLLKDGSLLWPSERSGRRHLYRYRDGTWTQLTEGEFDVGGIVAVDEEKGIAFVTADVPTARDRSLLRVRLVEGGFEPFSGVIDTHKTGGWIGAHASPDGRRFIGTFSGAGAPPILGAWQADGGVLLQMPRFILDYNSVGRRMELADSTRRPEFVTIPAADGTPLAGMLWRGRRRGPAIIYCYGGPESHLVADRWGGGTYLWHMRMLAKGYTILTVDNRGAGGYGRDFSRVVSGRLCDYEARDQAAAARWLGKEGIADPKRIGIWGWSYGGTLSLMCLLNHPDAFAAAVSVAPVTDWKDYDTAYTERYLGLPKDNEEGYRLSSPISFANKLARPLFLAHGMMDDNVHARNAVAFLDAAQRAGKVVEQSFWARGAHGIGGKKARRLLFARMEEFWQRHLGP